MIKTIISSYISYEKYIENLYISPSPNLVLVSQWAEVFWTVVLSLSLPALSFISRLVRGCQTPCQPLAFSLRGQSSTSSLGKPPPCPNSPLRLRVQGQGRGGELGRWSEIQLSSTRWGVWKPLQIYSVMIVNVSTVEGTSLYVQIYSGKWNEQKLDRVKNDPAALEKTALRDGDIGPVKNLLEEDH